MCDGPAGSGKTRIILERQHLICCKYPGARGLITRKWRSSMNETCLQVFNKEVLMDRDGNKYEDAPHFAVRDQKYVYDNGSEIIVAGLDDPTKVRSAQYDWAYVNEAIQIQESEWMEVSARLRNGRVPYQQMVGDTNPGPPRHWILSREKTGRLIRMPSNHKDNPVYWDAKKKKWTKKGEAYVNGILRDGLTGVTKSRLYDGEWVAAEGLVYPEWNADIHVIPKRTFPKDWPRYWVFDFGFRDPFVWIELVEDPESGNVYLSKELYHTELRVDQAAAIIRENTKGTVPYALICDWDAEDRATLEKELGYMTVSAFKFINIGVQVVKNRLRIDNPRFPNGPGFFVLDGAGIQVDKALTEKHKPKSAEDEFPMYQWDYNAKNVDKTKDAPIDINNHAMDTIRYGLCYIDSASLDPQELSRLEAYNDYDDDNDDEYAYSLY